MKSLPERLSQAPAGDGALPGEAVSAHQRRRILDAVAKLSAEGGYSSLTLEQIAKTARVAFATFYEHFATKEECFLAAFDEAVADAGARLAEAVDPDSPWPDQIAAGLAAFLGLVAEQPERAKLCLVEAQAAGPDSLARYEAALDSVVPKLSDGRALAADPDALPRSLEPSTVGGIAWLVQQRLVLDQLNEIEAMLPELLEIVLSPYVGEAEARRAASGAQAA